MIDVPPSTKLGTDPVAERVPAQLPWSSPLHGRLDRLWCDSTVLRDNVLGDPSRRPVWVQVPEAYIRDPDRRFPVVIVLAGFTGQVNRWEVRKAYQRPFPEVADELMHTRDVPPVVLVYVDGWTAYGGSQYVDSPGQGRYHTFLCEEVVPFVDDRYRTLPSREHRGITGSSSGGFGALVSAMLRPDLFGAVGSHAGDALYETNYLREFPTAARALREYDADIWRFWADFRSRPAFSKAGDQVLLMILAVAASFSSDPDGTVRLPFHARTGELRDDVWQRWLAWDPVRMLGQDRLADALLSMRGIWLDAGLQDDFHLDLGAQAIADRLRSRGVDEDRLHFELVPGDHWTIEGQFPAALRWLAGRLQ